MAILLAYPYDAPYIQAITLHNPQLGNSRQLNIKTSVKQNMFGSLYTHKKTPINSKLLLTFVMIPQLERDALESFYHNHIGHEIKYIDNRSISWRVLIANNALTITTRLDGCGYDAIIELLTV